MRWYKFIDTNGHAVLPNSVTEIEDRAFFECTRLTSIEIPNSVTKIGERAFYGCTWLTSIVVASDNPSFFQKRTAVLQEAAKKSSLDAKHP